jgi:hypothetical protein
MNKQARLQPIEWAGPEVVTAYGERTRHSRSMSSMKMVPQVCSTVYSCVHYVVLVRLSQCLHSKDAALCHSDSSDSLRLMLQQLLYCMLLS